MSSEFETFWQNPPLNYDDLQQHAFYQDQEDLRRDICAQYKDLKGLGIDLIEDCEVDDQLFHELINYVDQNYVPIINIEAIMDSPIVVQTIGRFLYRFICIDMIKYILPSAMKSLSITDPRELVVLNQVSLKEAMIRTIKSRIDAIKEIRSKADKSTTELYAELLRFVYYIDLIDNDISQLLEAFITPVCDAYSVNIISRNL